MNIKVLLINIVNVAFQVYFYLILARVILSWIRPMGGGAIVNFIYEMTEPFLGLFRRLIPMRVGMPIDFSPILALIALQLARSILLKLIYLL